MTDDDLPEVIDLRLRFLPDSRGRDVRLALALKRLRWWYGLEQVEPARPVEGPAPYRRRPAPPDVGGADAPSG